LKIEHDLHIDQALSKLSVNGTKEVEGHGQLEYELIDHDEVSNRHRACFSSHLTNPLHNGNLAFELHVYWPLITPWAAKSIIIVKALLKMKFCPTLSEARLVAILTEAFSYVLSVASYWATSYFSLLKA